MLRRSLLLGALASCSLLAAGTRTEAAYTYSSNIVINSVSGSAGTIVNTPGTTAVFTSTQGTVVTLTDITNPGIFLLNAPLTTKIGNIGVSTTSSAADGFTVNYTNVITITNPVLGSSSTGTFTINGALTLSGVMTQGGASAGTASNLYSGSFVQTAQIPAGTTFTLSFGNGIVNDLFGPPTVNATGGGANGGLGALVNSSTGVPEPASLVMMGLGLVSVAGVSVGRRMRKA